MSSEDVIPIAPVGDDEEINSPLTPRPVRVAAAPVGAVAARGFYWLAALSIATKFLAMGTQIVLSWFVGRTDFGLVGTSTTISSFFWLIQDAGLSQILIKRQRRFNIWCTPIFWLSILLALIAAALTAGSGFVAAHFMHQPMLVGLLLLLAVRGFTSAPATVPWAELNKDMRFALLAVLGTFLVASERGFMILFTSPLFRWGAYGFIVAMLLVSAMRTVLLWWYARSPVKLRLELRRWKFVFRDSALLTMAQTFQVITVYGDNLLLALFCTQDIVGDYYWAYNLSLQTTMLLTSNLGGVLFPALARLQREPERMRQGFVRAARMLTMIGTPGCLLQAAMARPVVQLVFGVRWLTAVPALQVLSIGMAFGLVNYPALGFLRAQGRFRTERKLSGICAGIFLVAAFIGAYLRGSLSMAVAVAIYNAVAGMLHMRTALGQEWRKIGSIFLPPVVLAASTVGCAYVLASRVTLSSYKTCAEQMGILVIVALPLYILGVWILMPELWVEAKNYLLPIFNRFGIGRSTGAAK